MHILRDTRSKQIEMILGETGHRHITIKLALWRQHRRQLQTAGFWHMTRKHVIEESTRALTGKFMFGKIGNLDGANIIADSGHFGSNIIMRTRTPESRVFMRIISIIGKPEDAFQTIGITHHCPARYQPVIKRRGLLPPAFWQGFIWECHDKAAFIIFRRFDRAPMRRCIITKARHIHSPYINRWFAIHHPFGHTQPNTTALTEASHNTNRNPVIGHARYRTNHRVTIWPKGKGPIDDVFNASRTKCRDTLKTYFQAVGNIIKFWFKQFMAK